MDAMNVPLAGPSAAGPRGGQAVFVPMNPASFFFSSRRFFEPVYSTTLPLEWVEFSAAVEEINLAASGAVPKWKRVGPCVALVAGFFAFLLGMVVMVAFSGFNGPSPFGLFLIFCGFVLFAGGGFGQVCMLAANSASTLSAMRRKLSELNARYADRQVDWQLHEQEHLELYRRAGSFDSRHAGHVGPGHVGHHSGGMGVRRVTTYTLVVQALASGGERVVPLPEVLSRQAFSSAQFSSVPPPSAPPA